MNYKVKYSEQYVRERIAQAAKQLRDKGILTDDTVYLIMMNGGIWFAMHLFDCLGDMNNAVYMIKGHSYSGQNRGELQWDYIPEMHLEGKRVVVLDDICDSGATINAIYHYFHDQVASIHFVTLLQRANTQLEEEISLYSCIHDDSKDFFVGCGLDDNEMGRMLPYIGVC